jgi:hypothetical protein
MPASSQTTASPSVAEIQLAKFVFDPDRYTADVVPRRLSPAEVAQFVKARIDRSTRFPAATQVEKAVDFYDAQEAGETLRTLLDRREVDQEDLRRSLVFTRTLAKAGTPADRDFAKDYYLYLVRRGDSLPLLEDLVSLCEALGPGDNANPLHERIAERIKILESKPVGDSAAQWELAKLQELDSLTLTRAEKANTVKSGLLKDANRVRRLDELVRTYLGLEGPYPEVLQPWAARQLRREVWAAQPPEQVTRTDDRTRREEVIQAFARAAASLPQDSQLSDEEKTFGRVRALRAMAFFGGKLSEKDRQFLKAHGPGQVDVLANE